jgi:hypothetical protein
MPECRTAWLLERKRCRQVEGETVEFPERLSRPCCCQTVQRLRLRSTIFRYDGNFNSIFDKAEFAGLEPGHPESSLTQPSVFSEGSWNRVTKQQHAVRLFD